MLAPIGFYDINRVRAFESTFPINELLGAAGTALGVLTLYLIGYWILYRTCGWREDAPARLGASLAKPGVLGWVLIAIVIALGGWAVLLVLAATGLENLGQHLDIVFASGSALVIAVSLTAASVLLGKAFHSVGKHADAIGAPRSPSASSGSAWLSSRCSTRSGSCSSSSWRRSGRSRSSFPSDQAPPALHPDVAVPRRRD